MSMFSKFKSLFVSDEEPEANFEISSPYNFKHNAHVKAVSTRLTLYFSPARMGISVDRLHFYFEQKVFLKSRNKPDVNEQPKKSPSTI